MLPRETRVAMTSNLGDLRSLENDVDKKALLWRFGVSDIFVKFTSVT